MALHRQPPIRGSARRGPGSAVARVVLVRAASWSAVLVVALLATADPTSRIGVPAYWSWLLTGLQVTALWGAGAGWGWGWPLGAAVQPGWITYAVLTDQLGFVPGCLVSWAIQTSVVMRARRTPRQAGGRPGPRARPEGRPRGTSALGGSSGRPLIKEQT